MKNQFHHIAWAALKANRGICLRATVVDWHAETLRIVNDTWSCRIELIAGGDVQRISRTFHQHQIGKGTVKTND